MIKVIGLKFCLYLHSVLALSTVSLKNSLGFLLVCYVAYTLFFLFGHFPKSLKFVVYYGKVLLWLVVIAIKHLFC